MAELSRSRARHLSPRSGAVCLLAASCLLPAAAAAQVDLEGTWHVLVHYTDDNSRHPEQPRWHDRVWAFERKGSRLQWVEYPIAVFEKESGRFERRSTGQYARVLGAWEPDAAQLANIADGLRVNTRGMKKKTLRGSDESGWDTTHRARAASASVVTYQENWRIEGLPRLPIFIQQDLLGSGRSETLEGVTLYEATTVGDGGDLIEGSYERDGTRHGTFQLRRAGAVGMLEEKTQSEIQAQGLRRGLRSSAEARAEAREAIALSLTSSGLQLPPEEIEKLTDRALELLLAGASERRVAEEIGAAIKQEHYAWVARGAEHDEASRYRLPFDSPVPRKLLIGPRGSLALAPGLNVGGGADSLTKNERLRNSYVFKMPVGSTVVAARDGKVVPSFDGIVYVVHEDGSYAGYWPIGDRAVEPGRQVAAGDVLGTTGKLDWKGFHSDVGSEPQLDFGVFVADDDGDAKTLKVLFDDGSAEGFHPVTGLSYGGRPQSGKN